MSEHSPIPWKWHPSYPKDERIGSIFRMERPGHAYAIAMQPRYVGDDQFAADAAFIVKAVNNHDALVKALETIAEENNLEPSPACKIARTALESMT